MSCCGNRRAASAPGAVAPRTAAARPRRAAAPVDFEYAGRGQLLVTGPSTGLLYRFTGRGARVRVDPRDAPSLYAVPALRPVR
jgi:hypothetical protein